MRDIYVKNTGYRVFGERTNGIWDIYNIYSGISSRKVFNFQNTAKIDCFRVT